MTDEENKWMSGAKKVRAEFYKAVAEADRIYPLDLTEVEEPTEEQIQLCHSHFLGELPYNPSVEPAHEFELVWASHDEPTLGCLKTVVTGTWADLAECLRTLIPSSKDNQVVVRLTK